MNISWSRFPFESGHCYGQFLICCRYCLIRLISSSLFRRLNITAWWSAIVSPLSNGNFSYIFPPGKWQGEQFFSRMGWICVLKLIVSLLRARGSLLSLVCSVFKRQNQEQVQQMNNRKTAFMLSGNGNYEKLYHFWYRPFTAQQIFVGLWAVFVMEIKSYLPSTVEV